MTIKNIGQMRLQDLVVFQTILESRSITAAAELLGFTQSAVSKQLKLLREHFGDELFVRTGDGMVATSKALAIAPQINALINGFETLSGEGSFSPDKIERDFILETTDEIQHFLLPRLVKYIEQESPKSRIIFRALDRDYAAKQLESGSVDLVVTLNWHIPEHFKQKKLFSDDFVCIHRVDHPLAANKLTLEAYLSARHMMVSPLGTGSGPVDEALGALGYKRFVSLACPYFMQVADALKESDLILTQQRRACLQLVENHPLMISELPVPLNPVNYFMFWHKRFDKDSSNRWLRDIVWKLLHQ